MTFQVKWDIVAVDRFSAVTYKINQAAEKVAASVEKIGKSSEKASASIEKTSKSLNRLGDVQNRVSSIMAVGSTIMSGFVIKMASDIEQAFNNTQSILQLSEEDFDVMKKNAKVMSLSLGVSMKDVAKAMENFGGVTEDELSKVRSSIMLSKSTGQSINEMISPFYDAVTAMKLTSTEAAAFSDKLSYIATVSNKVDLSVISRALSKGAPALLRHSDNLDSLLGIVVGLGEAGIETGNATRFLWKAQTSLLKPNKEMKKSFDSLQKSVGKSFFTDKGKLKPLAQVASIIMEASTKIKAAGDKTKEQVFDEFLLKAFGPQAANILKAIHEEQESILKFTNDLSKSADGYAKKMAMIKEKGFGAELTKLGIAMQGLLDSIFDEEFRAALAQVIKSIRVLITSLIEFLDKNPEIKKIAQTFIIVGGTLLPILASLSILNTKIGVISAIGAAFKRWPLFIAISALSAEVINLINNWGNLEKILSGSPIISANKSWSEWVNEKLINPLVGIPTQADFEAMAVRSFIPSVPSPLEETKNKLSLDINIKDRDNYVESVKTNASEMPSFNLGRNFVSIGR